MLSASLRSRGLKALAAAAAAVTLASCGVAPSPIIKSQFPPSKWGVAASPRVVANGQPVPAGGGRYLVGSPYRVAGRTYVPRENPRYSAIGLASWYGDNFHGRLTANGEVYDLDGLTAAHPTLPLPSYVRVTNLANNRSLVVRVNDRGPYVGDRVIDVSRNVAELLDFKQDGVARVKVDYVGPARMDGRDKQMLIASYQGPGAGPSRSPFRSPFGGFAVASAVPPPAPPRPRPVAYPPAAYPAPTTTAALPGPMALTPSYASPAALTSDDPLAPLILRNTGFARSYAAADTLSPAHLAAAELASGGSLAALDRAAAARARLTSAHAAPPAVIQLGLFSDPKNVAAITARFQALGTVQTVAANLAGKPVTTIRVVTDGRADASAVLAAAGAAGLKDAYIAR